MYFLKTKIFSQIYNNYEYIKLILQNILDFTKKQTKFHKKAPLRKCAVYIYIPVRLLLFSCSWFEVILKGFVREFRVERLVEEIFEEPVSIASSSVDMVSGKHAQRDRRPVFARRKVSVVFFRLKHTLNHFLISIF